MTDVFGSARRLSMAILGALVLALGATGPAAAAEFTFGDGELISPDDAWDDYFSTHPQGLDSPTRDPDPLVTNTAHALGDDPNRIFAFVHDTIEVIPLFGVQKGARGALIDKAATPFDQAHLLAELFRAAGYDADYVLGSVTLDHDQVESWLGVESAAAVTQILADGGIPATVADSGGVVSSVTLMHLWVRVSIGGTWYEFDAAFQAHSERTGTLTPAQLDSEMGFSASAFMSSANGALDDATSTMSGTPATVPTVENFNRNNVRTAMQSYAAALLHTMREDFEDADLAGVIGGRDITALPSPPAWQTSLPGHSAPYATFANDVPYALRTQVTVTVTSNLPNTSNDRTDVFPWRLDEIYGQELALLPAWQAPIMMPNQPAEPATFRVYQNGDDLLDVDLLGVGGSISVAFNHPYPAQQGDYLDRTLTATADLRAGSLQVIIGGGRMTSDFAAFLEARSDSEERHIEYHTGGEQEAWTRVGAQRATQRRYAASFATQFDAAAEVTAEIAGADIVLHDVLIAAQTIPVVGGTSPTPVATLGALSVEGALSANAHSALASDNSALRRTIVGLAGTLEGSVVQQHLDSVHAISVATRFDWASSDLNTQSHAFYLVNESNEQVAEALFGTLSINNGGALIFPGEHNLGPGDETELICSGGGGPPIPPCEIDGPERGGAFIAIGPNGAAHVVGVQGDALMGGGGTDPAITNPSQIFAIPEDFLERQVNARAEAYNVDLGSGTLTYSPPPDLVVGEGAYPYSLSFQRTFSSDTPPWSLTAVDNPPPNSFSTERFADTGWTSNFRAGATIGNEGMRAFGGQSPREAADTIALIRVLLVLNRDQASDLATLQYQLGAIHALAWWTDQLSYNSIQITHGASNRNYFRLADDTFQGQPGDVTEIELEGDRHLLDPIHSAQSSWLYWGICIRATAGDGSVSYYGDWVATYKAWTTPIQTCDTSVNVPIHAPLQPPEYWLLFRRQQFAEGAIVDFNGTQMANNLGREISFSGALMAGVSVVVTDQDVPTRQASFSLANGALSATGTDGETWAYQTGTAFRVFAPSSAATPIANFTFVPNGAVRGQVESVSDALGNTARYWISSGRVASVIDPAHYDTGCQPDPNAAPVETCNDVASRTYFDEYGQPARVANRLGHETRTTYDAFRRVESVTYPEGNREEYRYDDRHNRTLTRRIAKPGSGLDDIETEATYDSDCGIPLSQTDALDNVTTYTLLPGRCLISSMSQPPVDDGMTPEQQEVAPVTNYTWNGFGQLVRRTDPTGRVVTNAYDPSTNYLQSVTVEAGQTDIVTIFGRNAQGDIASVTDPRGYVHTGTYDLARRLTRYDGPSGTNAATRWTYSPDGLVTLIEQATGNTNDPWAETTYTYWPTGRVKTMTDPDGGVTQYFYNALNRLDYVLDPVNRRSENEYDAEGQVLQERHGVGTADEIVHATRTWTANGQLDWVEDANHNRSEMVHDGFDRLCRLFFPSPTTINVANAPAGTLACNTATDRSVHDYEEYAYDANGNRTSVRLRSEDAAHNDAISYTYDALNREIFKDIPGGASADVTSRYDRAGRRLYARFSTSTAYDAACATNYSGVEYCYDTVGRLQYETSFGRRLQFGYDQASNRTRITFADGLYAQYSYDQLNRVDQIGENGVFAGAQLLADYGYDTQARRTQLARGNGRTTAYAYTSASRLSALNHGPLDGTTNANWSYGYTPAGQVSSRTLIGAYEWTVPSLDQTYQRNGLNQYTSVAGTAFAHDRRGNLTSDGSRSFTYDLENRLIEASGSVSAQLNYDPLGRLRSVTANSVTTEFLYDGDRLVAEYDGATLLRRYVHGPGVDEPVVWYEGSATSNRNWLISDRQGSIIATTDGAGAATVYRYGPYGEPEGGVWTGSRFRYTGQIALPELRLYHYKARVYDPGQGRFLQTDPVGYDQDLNLYSYVGSDPLNRADSSGMCYETWEVCDYTEQETRALLNQAYSQATAGRVAGLQNIFANSRGGGNYDFKYGDTTDDTWTFNGETMNAAETGNFIAGFQAGAYDDKYNWSPNAEAAMYIAGLYYAITEGDESDPQDENSRRYIRMGVEAAENYVPSKQPPGVRRPPPIRRSQQQADRRTSDRRSDERRDSCRGSARRTSCDR